MVKSVSSRSFSQRAGAAGLAALLSATSSGCLATKYVYNPRTNDMEPVDAEVNDYDDYQLYVLQLSPNDATCDAAPTTFIAHNLCIGGGQLEQLGARMRYHGKHNKGPHRWVQEKVGSAFYWLGAGSKEPILFTGDAVPIAGAAGWRMIGVGDVDRGSRVYNTVKFVAGVGLVIGGIVIMGQGGSSGGGFNPAGQDGGGDHTIPRSGSYLLEPDSVQKIKQYIRENGGRAPINFTDESGAVHKLEGKIASVDGREQLDMYAKNFFAPSRATIEALDATDYRVASKDLEGITRSIAPASYSGVQSRDKYNGKRNRNY